MTAVRPAPPHPDGTPDSGPDSAPDSGPHSASENAPDRAARSAAWASALDRLAEAERRWSGPIPAGVRALARAGSAAAARANARAAERRSLDRTADGLRRAVAGRRRRLPAHRAPADAVLARRVADLRRWRAVAVARATPARL